MPPHLDDQKLDELNINSTGVVFHRLCNVKLMAEPRIYTFQRSMILTLGEKLELVAHQLLQHAGQSKEHPEIINAGKQKTTAPLFHFRMTPDQ